MLISGDFLEAQLPKEKWYLWKYFTTDIQKHFVKYYYVFGEVSQFVNHTGFFCKIRWQQLLLNRIVTLEKAMETAREQMDLDTIVLIESGKFFKADKGEKDTFDE